MFSLSVQWLWLVLQRFPLMMTLNSLSFLLFGENSENERTADIILQIHVNLSFLFTNPNYWEIRKLVNSDRALIDQNSQFNIQYSQYSHFNIHIIHNSISQIYKSSSYQMTCTSHIMGQSKSWSCLNSSLNWPHIFSVGLTVVQGCEM